MISRILTLLLMGAVFGFVTPAFAQEAAASVEEAPAAATEQSAESAEPAVAEEQAEAEAAEAEAEVPAEAAAETASDAVAAESTESVDSAAAAAPSDAAADFARRVELATEMHKLRPTAEQVDAAVESVSRQLPPEQASNFKVNAGNLLNYRAIEKISINAMAETFTTGELESMVEYYSKPEAKSIAGKYETYQQKVGPEIVKMIDRAIMRMRTGDAAP